MKIAHIAIWARDLEVVCAFYEHLGATRGARYDNTATGFTSYFLSWPASDVRLEVMHKGGLTVSSSAPTTGFAHIALSVGSETAVDEAARGLAKNGVDVVDGPRRTGDGYYECVVADPEGNRVELTS